MYMELCNINPSFGAPFFVSTVDFVTNVTNYISFGIKVTRQHLLTVEKLYRAHDGFVHFYGIQS